MIGNAKEGLIKIIRHLLHSDEELRFLLQLQQEDLEKLVAVVRARIDDPR